VSSRPNLLPGCPASPSFGVPLGLVALLRAIAGFFAFVLYAVLATFEPLVRLALLLLALAGLVTCGVYRFLLKDPHFPLWTMLIFSISMCVLSGAYAVLLRKLFRG
jgi:hypothetical protein